jgi:hypothetical protein
MVMCCNYQIQLSLHNVDEMLRAIDPGYHWGRRQEEIEVKDAENVRLLNSIAMDFHANFDKRYFQ